LITPCAATSTLTHLPRQVAESGSFGDELNPEQYAKATVLAPVAMMSATAAASRRLGRLTYIYFEDEPTLGGQTAHQGRGAADCGEHGEAAGAVAQALSLSRRSLIAGVDERPELRA
jgi:hypothetical protein